MALVLLASGVFAFRGKGQEKVRLQTSGGFNGFTLRSVRGNGTAETRLLQNWQDFLFRGARVGRALQYHKLAPTQMSADRFRRVSNVGEVRLPVGIERSRDRSEEHTSELQSPYDLVCRLLLEKKTGWPPAWGPPVRPRWRGGLADGVEVAQGLGVGACQAGLAVGHASLLAERPGQGLGAALGGTGGGRGRPVAGFDGRTVPSPRALASSVPSVLNATPCTPFSGLVAWMGARTRRPVAGFHFFLVLPPPPGSSLFPYTTLFR